MYDNATLEHKCRTLWTEVLCAVESRVSSVNAYMHAFRAPIGCRMLGSDAVHLEQSSTQRSLVARLDLKDHAVDVNVSQGRRWASGKRLLLAMLGDGRIYVTDGKALMGDPMAVAKLLMSVLLNNSPEAASGAELREFRSWTSAIITARPARSKIVVPIEIVADGGTHTGSTLDMSINGLCVQVAADLPEGKQVVVSRGLERSDFRVIWAERTGESTTAGLECLNPPLSWAHDAA